MNINKCTLNKGIEKCSTKIGFTAVYRLLEFQGPKILAPAKSLLALLTGMFATLTLTSTLPSCV